MDKFDPNLVSEKNKPSEYLVLHNEIKIFTKYIIDLGKEFS